MKLTGLWGCVMLAACSEGATPPTRATEASEAPSAASPAQPVEAAEVAAAAEASAPERSPEAGEPAEAGGATQAAQATAEATSPPPEVPRPYPEGVDAQAAIDAAVAGASGKRVLLLFGANWCPWCRRLEHTLRHDAAVAAKLAEKFVVVHVDVGPRDSSVNRDVARRYGDPLSKGLPCIVVLDARGQVEHVQETGVFERGDRHDPARLLAFLQTWEP